MITGAAPSHVSYTLYTADAYAKRNGETTLFDITSNPDQTWGYDSKPGPAHAADVGKWIHETKREDNVWGTIDIPDHGAVKIYNSGVMELENIPRTGPLKIDWKHISTAEDRAAAILDQYPESMLTKAETAVSSETQKDRYASFLNTIMSVDALFP